MLVRIANSEDPCQTATDVWVCTFCPMPMSHKKGGMLIWVKMIVCCSWHQRRGRPERLNYVDNQE